MKQGYFITGTDTEVGKTRVSVALIRALRDQGLRVSVMKPVASGCVEKSGRLRNGDADILREVSNVDADYDTVCPYRFIEPVAPHIAAQVAGIDISIDRIVRCYQTLKSRSDAVIVEGVGGWQVPLSDTQNLSDLAQAISLPVVIVVAARLGCINHALLTVESILASGLQITGWVYNRIDPAMMQADAVRDALVQRMPAKLIADIPWQEDPEAIRIAL